MLLDRSLPVNGNLKLYIRRVRRDGLARLGASANEALLTELTAAEEPKRIVKLARLLTRVSNVRSPQPLPTWVRADKAQRLEVVEKWRTRIAEAGRLEPAPLAGPAYAAPATTQAATSTECRPPQPGLTCPIADEQVYLTWGC